MLLPDVSACWKIQCATERSAARSRILAGVVGSVTLRSDDPAQEIDGFAAERETYDDLREEMEKSSISARSVDRERRYITYECQYSNISRSRKRSRSPRKLRVKVICFPYIDVKLHDLRLLSSSRRPRAK